MRWQGIAICLRCFNAPRAERPIVVGQADSASALTRYGSRLALVGKTDPMPLDSIARPSDQAVH